MPKRSASSTTITVALGTSTPTSITVVAISTWSSPARKRPITASFSADGQPAVEQAEPQTGQLGGLEAGEGLLGRRDLELVALPDQRAHDVGLATGGHLLAHLGPHLGLLARRPAPTW